MEDLITDFSYDDLVNPYPIYVESVGTIRSPKVDDIFKLSIGEYNQYICFLTMTPKDYYKNVGEIDVYNSMDDSYKMSIDMYDILTSEDFVMYLSDILSFFIIEDCVWDKTSNSFNVCRYNSDNESDGIIVGNINRDNFFTVKKLILARNNIKIKSNIIDAKKFKKKRAMKIMAKLTKANEELKTTSKYNKDLELGNIISKVCARHSSINYINVGDLTIYQLYDIFYSMIGNIRYDIYGRILAQHGGKAVPDFKDTDWYKNTNT